jgi:glycosyltransferase involved in cell wall biosynthesis
MLKAALYDPYLDTLGGGERYCLSVVETLLSSGYSVDIFWSGDSQILTKAKDRFALDISKANLVPDIFNEHPHQIECIDNREGITKVISKKAHPQSIVKKAQSFINKYQITKSYDLFFYLSDWSIPFLFSKNNLLHIQVPFIKPSTSKEKLFNSIKLYFINKVICNSEFTQKFAIAKFGSKCHVLYPPVDTQQFDPNSTKENIILSVGRFDNLLNSKKQDILIEAFRKLYERNKNTGWKLVLAGGSLQLPENNSYLLHLQTLANGLPVEFLVNPDFSQIKNIYQSSKIYWHAAGFDVDQENHPENTEHFGIAPVEAMAAGAVPLVINKGGLNEIVTDGVTGYLWQTIDDLVSKTQLLIGFPDNWQKLSTSAIQSSTKFSKESFNINFRQLLNI